MSTEPPSPDPGPVCPLCGRRAPGSVRAFPFGHRPVVMCELCAGSITASLFGPRAALEPGDDEDLPGAALPDAPPA